MPRIREFVQRIVEDLNGYRDENGPWRAWANQAISTTSVYVYVLPPGLKRPLEIRIADHSKPEGFGPSRRVEHLDPLDQLEWLVRILPRELRVKHSPQLAGFLEERRRRLSALKAAASRAERATERAHRVSAKIDAWLGTTDGLEEALRHAPRDPDGFWRDGDPTELAEFLRARFPEAPKDVIQRFTGAKVDNPIWRVANYRALLAHVASRGDEVVESHEFGPFVVARNRKTGALVGYGRCEGVGVAGALPTEWTDLIGARDAFAWPIEMSSWFERQQPLCEQLVTAGEIGQGGDWELLDGIVKHANRVMAKSVAERREIVSWIEWCPDMRAIDSYNLPHPPPGTPRRCHYVPAKHSPRAYGKHWHIRLPVVARAGALVPNPK